MKFIQLVLLIILALNFGQAQDSFIDGVIVTFQNDTIYCKVPNERHFGKRIPIIRNERGKKELFKTREVQYIVTESVAYQNLRFNQGKRSVQKLMEIFALGAINLYIEHKIIEAPTPTVFVVANRARREIRAKATIYSKKYSVIYVLNKNGMTYYLSKENFLEVIIPLISDYAALKRKIERESYRYEHIKRIIDSYNKYHSLEL